LAKLLINIELKFIFDVLHIYYYEQLFNKILNS